MNLSESTQRIKEILEFYRILSANDDMSDSQLGESYPIIYEYIPIDEISSL